MMPDFLRDSPFAANISHICRIPAVSAKLADFPDDLAPELAGMLRSREINQLYTHQLQAWAAIRAGQDVVIETPTASGKTLCYNLPVVQERLHDPAACAFYLFPTKALSQDQQAELNTLLQALPQTVRAVTYDGDTPQSIRKTAREQASIIITNPDMLHSGILPNHAKWSRFFAALKYIVIDEMHMYRGVFGSHVANVIRRLLRIARFYGAEPRFIFCSATIANPAELAEALIGRPVQLINQNGAARAERYLVLYNPPVTDVVQGIRISTALESVKLSAWLLRQGLKTILFARSRMKVELIASYLNEQFRNVFTENHGIRVEPYRGGLLPNERRAIEKGLRDGDIHGVVSTNALELGIDIGGLEAAVIAGWPGNLASFRQQAGRAGRRQGISWQFFIAGSAPMDQFLLEHPDRILADAAESGQINPDNIYIYMDHVKCAAFELPFSENDVFGSDLQAALEYLQEDGLVRKTQGRWFWSDSAFPAEKLSLRSATADNVVIIDETDGRNQVIGEMDRPGAKEYLYDNAVYIHRGNQFMVRKLDIENRICQVVESDVNYFTDAVVKIDIKVLSEDLDLNDGHLRQVCGDILLRSQVEKFKKLRFNSHENIGYGEIYLPPEEIQTRALMLSASSDTSFGRRLAALPSDAARAHVLSAITYLLRNLAPLHLLCDRVDIGTSWNIRDEHFGVPSLYIWDRYPGGTGLAENLPPYLQDLFAKAANRISSCSCENGCPSCIGLVDEALGRLAGRKKMVLPFLGMDY